MNQPDLFQNREPLARNTDVRTSHQSGHEFTTSGKRNQQKAQVLNALKANPGLTARELASFASISGEITHKRLPDLREDGLVYNGEARRCSITSKQAMTWFAR